jgi:hypothetical protein
MSPVIPYFKHIISGFALHIVPLPSGSRGGMVAGVGTRNRLFSVSRYTENCVLPDYRNSHHTRNGVPWRFSETNRLLKCFVDLFHAASISNTETLCSAKPEHRSNLDGNT